METSTKQLIVDCMVDWLLNRADSVEEKTAARKVVELTKSNNLPEEETHQLMAKAIEEVPNWRENKFWDGKTSKNMR